jgi:hypothetical protein
MPLESLLAEITRLHFPNPPATLQQIAAFEARIGWKLEPELRAFYLHCNGAALFDSPPDMKYRILPLERIERARTAIMGIDEDAYGSASHYTLVDMQDTSFVVLDVAQRIHGHSPLFDAFHETYPEVERIADSFEEFLEKALDSGNRAYWLGRVGGP